eukprot:619024-Amphidinium_carterae.2
MDPRSPLVALGLNMRPISTKEWRCRPSSQTPRMGRLPAHPTGDCAAAGRCAFLHITGHKLNWPFLSNVVAIQDSQKNMEGVFERDTERLCSLWEALRC